MTDYDIILIISDALKNDSVYWKSHFLQRLREREITLENVFEVLRSITIVERYVDDRPFPSYLVLGYIDKEPFHIVLSVNTESKEIHMITIYRPDSTRWKDEFRRRT